MEKISPEYGKCLAFAMLQSVAGLYDIRFYGTPDFACGDTGIYYVPCMGAKTTGDGKNTCVRWGDDDEVFGTARDMVEKLGSEDIPDEIRDIRIFLEFGCGMEYHECYSVCRKICGNLSGRASSVYAYFPSAGKLFECTRSETRIYDLGMHQGQLIDAAYRLHGRTA